MIRWLGSGPELGLGLGVGPWIELGLFLVALARAGGRELESVVIGELAQRQLAVLLGSGLGLGARG